MAISTVDQLETGLTSQFSKYITGKNDPAATVAVAGQPHSYWLASGVPSAGAAPGATAIAYTNLTVGAMNFRQVGSNLKSYLARLSASSTVAGAITNLPTVEIHDRLIAMSGLSGILTTQQNVTGLDLSSFLAGNNIAARIGDANYSDVQWWVEFYTAIGGTASVATINVTYNDGTTGNLTSISAFGRQITRLIPLNVLIPAADSGKYIRGINSITLSASTATAGNFGFTATRYRTGLLLPEINKVHTAGWTHTGMPEIYDSSCLFPIAIAPSTNLGILRINGLIVHG